MKNGVLKRQQTGSAKGQLICELEGINFLGTSKAMRLIKQCYFPSRKNIMAASVFYFHTFPFKKKKEKRNSKQIYLLLEWWHLFCLFFCRGYVKMLIRKLNFSEILAPLWPQTAWLLVKMSSQYTSHFSPYPSGIICNEVWFHITVQPPYPVAMPNTTCIALCLLRSANL